MWLWALRISGGGGGGPLMWLYRIRLSLAPFCHAKGGATELSPVPRTRSREFGIICICTCIYIFGANLQEIIVQVQCTLYSKWLFISTQIAVSMHVASILGATIKSPTCNLHTNKDLTSHPATLV